MIVGMDGFIDFFHNWTDYTEGFGILTGEFWIGLIKYIDLLTIKQTVYKSI